MRPAALLGFLCVSWSIMCLTEGVTIREMLRRRRQTCEYGSYKHGNLDCCRCPAGFYVKEHCTSSETAATCERCEGEYYRDQPNGKENCEPCTVCNEQSYRRVLRKCTPGADTVCTCLDQYYCNQGDKCKVCHRCDQCPDSSVKLACTATNNTVCGEKEEGSNVAAIVSPVVIIAVIAIASAVVFIFLWKKKKYCFREPVSENREEEEALQDDVNLTPVLSDIAQLLGLRVVKNVVNPLVTIVDIENAQEEHPKNAAEQAEQLLRTWYQKHGLPKAYRTLVRKLNEKGYKTQANDVKRIVEQQLRNEE